MTNEKLISALRRIAGEADLGPTAEMLVSVLLEQAVSIRSSGNRIPPARHLETLCFRATRDTSLTKRSKGLAETIEHLKAQKNDLILLGVDAPLGAFVVLLDADSGEVAGVYSQPASKSDQ